MSFLSALVVPLLLLFAGTAVFKKVDVFAALTGGAEEGLRVVLRMAVTLIPLLTAISMFRASGALEALTGLLTPLCAAIGIPPEVAPLLLLRPLSGGGALAVGTDIITSSGADSFPGRVVAVVLGSTETTLYTTALYFAAAGVKDTRYVIPVALIADFSAFLFASLSVRLFLGA